MTTLSDDDSFTVNAPLVVSEVLDGEAIIMHHGTGHYFNSTDSGAHIWACIEGTASANSIADSLTLNYNISRERAVAAAREFLQRLMAHGLITRGTKVPEAQPTMASERREFSDPYLGVHEDLADMLLLDPIHDVGESGWPAPKPQSGFGR